MKKIFILFLCVCYTTLVLSAQCGPGNSQSELSVNNVRTTVLSGGDLWWNLQDAKYEVPKVEPDSKIPSRHSIYSGAIWMGGYDDSGQLSLAAEMYRQAGNDYSPGPADENYENGCEHFDHHWMVMGADISAFITAYGAGAVEGIADVPVSIAVWPAKGNPHFADFELPENSDLAPFFDNDNDGLYDPLQGDYPVVYRAVKESYADQMIWWMFNDNKNVHSNSGGNPLGVEVGVTAFAFSTDDAINNYTFYNYEIRNKSASTYSDFYIGHFIDTDLGNYLDDYVGFYPGQGIAYAYNGDDFDEGDTGYGSDIPYVAFEYINQPDSDIDINISHFIKFYNDISQTGNPEQAIDYYHFLQGRQKDGNLFADPDGQPVENYLYPGNPADCSQWSECCENNSPSDRRMVISSGPYTWGPEERIHFTLPVLWSDSLTYPCPDMYTALETSQSELMDFLNDFANGNTAGAMGINATDGIKVSTAFPNPCRDMVNFYLENSALEGKLLIKNLLGETVLSSTDWKKGVKISELKPGIYFALLETNNSQRYLDKIVKR